MDIRAPTSGRSSVRMDTCALTSAHALVSRYEYRMDKSVLRQHFAKYGMRSGVNPGEHTLVRLLHMICGTGIKWMTDAELAELRVEVELTESLSESMRIAADRLKQQLDEQTKMCVCLWNVY